jgi:hypothetical protein
MNFILVGDEVVNLAHVMAIRVEGDAIVFLMARPLGHVHTVKTKSPYTIEEVYAIVKKFNEE